MTDIETELSYCLLQNTQVSSEASVCVDASFFKATLCFLPDLFPRCLFFKLSTLGFLAAGALITVEAEDELEEEDDEDEEEDDEEEDDEEEDEVELERGRGGSIGSDLPVLIGSEGLGSKGLGSKGLGSEIFGRIVSDDTGFFCNFGILYEAITFLTGFSGEGDFPKRVSILVLRVGLGTEDFERVLDEELEEGFEEGTRGLVEVMDLDEDFTLLEDMITNMREKRRKRTEKKHNESRPGSK